MDHGGDVVERIGGPLLARLQDLVELGGGVASDAPGHAARRPHDLHDGLGLELPIDTGHTR